MAERTLLSAQDGITVEEEVRPDAVLPILFGTATVSATPIQVAAWIGAVHTYPRWQYRCEEARALEQPDGSFMTYNRVGAPWPVSDRDVLMRSTRTDNADGSIRIEFRSTDESGVVNAPTSTGAVRMERLVGSYQLIPSGTGTQVLYTVDSDPGGSLPAWLVKQASKELPYRTLKALRARAETGPPPLP